MEDVFAVGEAQGDVHGLATAVARALGDGSSASPESSAEIGGEAGSAAPFLIEIPMPVRSHTQQHPPTLVYRPACSI